MWTQQDLPQPTFGDQRAIVAEVGQSINNSVKLAPLEGGADADGVASMLSKLGTALGAAFADEPDDGAPGGEGGEGTRA